MSKKIKWAEDDIDGYLNFYAISEDGTVSHWTLVKTAMCHSVILNITFTKKLNNHVPETKRVLKGEVHILIQIQILTLWNCEL